jgi:chemotaxis response regulator CheB
MNKEKTNKSPEKREAAGTPKRIPRKAVPSKGKQGARPHFPIVGIGASAGGLEALELFLRNVPPESGMAFVIIQHLDPTHKGINTKTFSISQPRSAALRVFCLTERRVIFNPAGLDR